MSKVLVHCRYTTHHMAIRKVIHGLVSNLKDDGQIKYILAINENNISDFDGYSLEKFVIPCDSDNAILNHLYNILLLPLVCLRYRIKVIIFPQISFFVFTFAKKIVFMHDLIEYKVTNQKKHKHIARQLFYPWVAKRADRIITVSENSAKDLNKILGVPKDKITIAYDGIDHIYKYSGIPKEEACILVSEKFNIKNYLFYVGYISEPQKNIVFMLGAIEKYIKKSGDQFEIVLAGPLGLNHQMIFDKASELGLNLKYLGKVSERDLACLFKAASLFCFPSKYEGFGMPVAEAMCMGVPVITSNTSSLPEVAGGAALLIDPDNTEELVSAIERVRCDASLSRAMVEKGLIVSKRYGWSGFAQQVVNNIKEELR